MTIINLEIELYELEFVEQPSKDELYRLKPESDDVMNNVAGMAYNIYSESFDKNIECTLGDNPEIEEILARQYLKELKGRVL